LWERDVCACERAREREKRRKEELMQGGEKCVRVTKRQRGRDGETDTEKEREREREREKARAQARAREVCVFVRERALVAGVELEVFS